jgi:transposase-like protein
MRRPIFVRPISDAERESLEAGLRSADAFVLRRCQILLASSRRENAYQIARSLGCNPQTVRNAIHLFNESGLQAALSRGSSRPRTITRPSTPRALSDSGRCFIRTLGALAQRAAFGPCGWPLR